MTTSAHRRHANGEFRPKADSLRPLASSFMRAVMTVEQADIVDGIGVRRDGSAVEMTISDHLEWDDPRHAGLLAAKIEAYANAFLSGELARSYPAATGKPACIKLVYLHSPSREAERLLNNIAQHLSDVGIGFSHLAPAAGVLSALTDSNVGFPARSRGLPTTLCGRHSCGKGFLELMQGWLVRPCVRPVGAALEGRGP